MIGRRLRESHKRGGRWVLMKNGCLLVYFRNKDSREDREQHLANIANVTPKNETSRERKEGSSMKLSRLRSPCCPFTTLFLLPPSDLFLCSVYALAVCIVCLESAIPLSIFKAPFNMTGSETPLFWQDPLIFVTSTWPVFGSFCKTFNSNHQSLITKFNWFSPTNLNGKIKTPNQT